MYCCDRCKKPIDKYENRMLTISANDSGLRTLNDPMLRSDGEYCYCSECADIIIKALNEEAPKP